MPRALTPDEIVIARKNGFDVPNNAVVDDQGNVSVGATAPPPPEASSWTDTAKDIGGFVKRQITSSALPAALGGVAATGAGALMAGLGVRAPAAMIMGPAILGTGAAMAGKYLQDKALNKYAVDNPTTPTAEFVKATEKDVQEHPYLSTAASTLAAPFAGGGFMPSVKNLVQAPKRAAAMAGTMGGIDVATQQISHPGQLDLGQLAIAAGTGSLYGGRNKPMSSAVPENEIAALAKMQKPAAPKFFHEQPGFNMEQVLAMPPEALKTIAQAATGGKSKFFNSLATIAAKGPLVPEDVIRLSSEGPSKDYGNVAADVLLKRYGPEAIAAKENKLEGAALTAGDKASAAEAANLAKTQEAVDASKVATQANPPVIAKPAAESAAAITAAQPSNVASQRKAIQAQEAEFAKLMAKAETFPEGSTERNVWLRGLAQQRTDIDAAWEKLAAGLPGEITPKAGVGLEEVKNPRELTSIKPPKAENEPPPETVTPPDEAPTLSTEAPPPQPGPIKGTPGEVAPNAPKDTGVEQPLAPAYEAKKAALGISPKPEQTIKLPGPVEDFRAGLTMKGVIGDQARGLLATHPALKGKLTGNPAEAFDKLPAGDRIKLAELSDKGAERWPAAKLTSEAERLVGRKLSIPGQPRSATTSSALPEESPGGLKVKSAQEQAAKKGGQAGSVLNPFRDVEEYRARIKGLIGSAAKGIAKITVDPLKYGVTVKGKTYGGTEEVLGQLARKDSTGAHVANALKNAEVAQRQFEGPEQQQLRDLGKEVPSLADRNAVHDYAMNLKHGEGEAIELTPKQQKLYNELQAMYNKTGVAAQEDGPYVSSVDAKGRPIERPLELLPNGFPETTDPQVRKSLQNPNGNEETFNKLREDFITWRIDKFGDSRESAEKSFADRLPGFQASQSPDATFRALRLEASEGLPPSWRNRDPIASMKSYMGHYSHDMAFHTFVERDPVVATALGIESNGRGELHPKEVTDSKGRKVTFGELKSNPNVTKELRHFVGGFAGNDESLVHAISAGSLGTITQAYNFGQTAAMTFAEKPSDYKMIISGLVNAFKPEATRTAIRAGSARASRNVLPTVAMDVDNAVNKYSALWSEATGADAIAKGNDVFLDTVGRLKAKARILAGDKDYVSRYAPPNWETMPPEKVIDFMAANYAREFAGGYGGAGLPGRLLRGDHGIIGKYFNLSRWSVERFNHWYDKSVIPAKEGDLMPLLKSLTVGTLVGSEVMNLMKKALQERDPRELTWAEQFKLGGKDYAYSFFSKMALASQTGILGDVLFGLMQGINSEAPRGFNNLAISAASDAAERVLQFGNAIAKGDVNPFSPDGIPKLFFNIAQDRIQLLRVATQDIQDTGDREERIAKRLGYMPKQGMHFGHELRNPWSEADAYRTENQGQLERIFDRKAAQGLHLEAPETDVRRSKMMSDDGRVGYYDFVADAQGNKAADAALERDKESSAKKREMFTSALRR